MKTITIYNSPFNKSMGIEGKAEIIEDLRPATDLLKWVRVKFEDGEIKRRLILR